MLAMVPAVLPQLPHRLVCLGRGGVTRGLWPNINRGLKGWCHSIQGCR